MENESFRVIVASQDVEQLVSHAAFLANVSADAAERLVTSFEAAAASLSVSPLRRPFLRARFIPGNTYRTLLFEKRYMLIYQVIDQAVYIDHVVDCRQDYSWFLHNTTR